MDIRLFDELKRTDDGPAKYSEPYFHYVNRTNRAHFRRARATLEKWFRAFAAENPNDTEHLRKSFRSSRGQAHLSALTELYVHHMLMDHGFTTIVHPPLAGSNVHPDFGVLRDDIPLCVIEVALVYGCERRAGKEKRDANIFDAVDAVNSPNFFVDVNIIQRSSKMQPRLSGITIFLQNRIDKCDYQQIQRLGRRSKDYPAWEYEENGWLIRFKPRPVSEAGCRQRTGESRVVGMSGCEVFMIVLDEAIKQKVLEKAGKYGRFQEPFLIVLNVVRDSIHCNDEELMDALVGKSVCDVTICPDGSEKIVPRRERNGVWSTSSKGIANEHVSGVMVIPGLNAGTLETAKPVLWHHPFAKYPISFDDLDVEQRYFDKQTRILQTHNAK